MICAVLKAVIPCSNERLASLEMTTANTSISTQFLRLSVGSMSSGDVLNFILVIAFADLTGVTGLRFDIVTGPACAGSAKCFTTAEQNQCIGVD